MTKLFEKALRLEQEAAEFGFCWENTQQIMAQICSECNEIQEHLLPDQNHVHPSPLLQEEIGDLFHAVVSLCAFCHLDPTEILRLAVDKFESRFQMVQTLARQQGLTSLKGYPFDILMHYWNAAKRATDENALEGTHPNTMVYPEQTSLDDFQLDSRLESSSFFLMDWPLSRVLLKNNHHFPWFILVPRYKELREIFELSPEDSHQFQQESQQLAQLIKQFFQADKINIASLGNVVPQFHLHIVARFHRDPLWPHGIWQENTPEAPYSEPIPWLPSFIQALKNTPYAM